MEFEELYKTSVGLWPDEIDISDGKEEDNGVFFQKLSSVWNEVEVKAKLMGEWYDLMTWVIFSNFHNMAKIQLKEGRKTIRKTEIETDKVKNDLIQNLRVEGYEDMLDDFKKFNPAY